MQKLLGGVVIFILKLLAQLPLSVLYFVARIVSFLLNTIFPYRKQVIDQNILRCFPNKSELERTEIRKGFYSFLSRMLVETLKSYHLSNNELQQLVTFYFSDELLNYLKNNQPIIVMMAHYGNWEVIGLAADHEDVYFHSLYRQLKNQTINAWMLQNRQRFGLILLNERESLRELATRLKEKKGNFITFITDQAAHPSRACKVSFFNQETNFIKGPERLARRFNCPVFFAHIAVENGKYLVSFKPISMKPKETTDNEIIQRFAHCVEDMVKDNPAYWLWSHNRWKYNE